MEELEALAIAAFHARSLDQIVERREAEPSLVGPAVRVEEQTEVVLGIGVAGEPTSGVDRRRIRGVSGRRVGAPRHDGDRQPEHRTPGLQHRVQHGQVVLEGGHREGSGEPGASQVLATLVWIEPHGDVRRVALQQRRDDAAGGHDHVERSHRHQRVSIDGARQREPELEVRERRMAMVEREITGPGRRPQRGVWDLRREKVREPGRVSDGDHVELVALVRLDRPADR